MKYQILHVSSKRMRLHLLCQRLTISQADCLQLFLLELPQVEKAVVHERTCDVVVFYTSDASAIYHALSAYQEQKEELPISVTSPRALNRKYQEKLMGMLVFRFLRKLFLPAPLRFFFTIYRALPYLYRGLRCAINGKAQVELLDTLSIGISLLRGDYSTASSVMFLLKLGELLEEWTRKKSLDDLARCMSLNVDQVWLVTNGQDVLTPIAQIQTGDCIRVQTGNLIPLDGVVTQGEAFVNQASMTGESLAVRKFVGAPVYAGTVVEEGSCLITVQQQSGTGRYDRIISMIEESEKLKSATENRALALADRLVPYTLVGTVLTYALTRNLTRAISILMVDFSCALKLSMPLAVLSAMQECSVEHMTVKGGKYLELLAKADTIVFDKTGTLTYAQPTVAKVVPFNNTDETQVLRISACLEEHYPHSIANAVVREAELRGIAHEELHSQVEYVVAHGIASRINGEKAIIGSYHFVFEDEKCSIREEEKAAFQALSPAFSHLYLAIGGVLSGVVCILDPLRAEAAQVLDALRKAGIKKTVMMTGDNRYTAQAIADEVGVDVFFSEVLPEDKAHFVERERAAGKTVVMIGDGINDAPALSAADVGIAISDGAAIAREIADITIAADNLWELVVLKKIANALSRRVSSNYRFVLGFNGGLIVLGAAGLLQPTSSALLHNLSTLGISLRSMTDLLTEKEKSRPTLEKFSR